jgi:cytoskeletal protein CcmA (bactofilin family)
LKGKQIISPGIHNTLAEGTVLTGEIKAEEDFRIDGVVEGIINCNGKIVIGPKGSVNGQINCISAELSGKLQGTIQTTGVLVIKSTALFSGDATTKTMEIESGAIFNGTCTMVDDSSSNQ